MSTADQITEQAIQAAGANVAPRITPADIEANIVSEHYFTPAQAVGRLVIAGGARIPMGLSESETNPPSLSLLTFCVLVLRNGFTVTGESACASPENFNAGIGRRVARENAVAKCWPLMGYELKCRLSNNPPDVGTCGAQEI
jgi:hypothetical protein